MLGFVDWAWAGNAADSARVTANSAANCLLPGDIERNFPDFKSGLLPAASETGAFCLVLKTNAIPSCYIDPVMLRNTP
jgi:hypothetical protein